MAGRAIGLGLGLRLRLLETLHRQVNEIRLQ